MKRVAVVTALVLSLALVGAALAGLPNSKVTVQVKDGQILPPSQTTPWATILKQTVKTASSKSVIVNPSLVCSLFTFTKAKSAEGIVDTDLAYGAIRVRVKATNVDTDEVYWAEPDGGAALNGVIYSRRLQVLSAKFAGIPTGDTTYEDEFVSLLLLTSDAHAFNFLLYDLPQGTYQVEVQARTVTFTLGDTATAYAWIGKGAVTMEEVRLIKDPADEYVIE